MSTTLDRFRVAMKFSLWMWALYWPGGGILLLIGGLDPISILVTAGSFTAFILLMFMGGLRSDSSRNMKEFFLERPMYLVAGFVLLVLVAPLIGAVENLGLALFSTLYLAAIALVGVRMAQHHRAQGGSVLATRADQVFILVALTGAASLLVFLDAWGQLFGLSGIGGSRVSVAGVNWINLLYPPLLMLATRPFRDPLQWPRRRRVPAADDAPAPKPVKA